MRERLLVLCCLACLGGCSGLPGVPATQPPGAAYPPLVPLGPLLAQSDATGPQNSGVAGPALAARAADLRRRASLLRDMPI